MKKTGLLLLLNLTAPVFLRAQHNIVLDNNRKAITSLIDRYSEAREKRDTVMLKTVLTSDVDQLVSTGEWRDGLRAAIDGMMKSSANTPGTRTLHIEKMKMLAAGVAIVDCRYEIQNDDGTARKMWSSFIVVHQKSGWKITAIRNMLPTVQP